MKSGEELFQELVNVEFTFRKFYDQNIENNNSMSAVYSWCETLFTTQEGFLT